MKKDDDLDPLLKKVAREGGTEAPFSGKYATETADGVYHCSVCGNALFASGTKFETKIPGLMGWPSFEDAIPGSIEFKQDNKLDMQRTEVVCANCKSHLGHLFEDDSETKTGKHFCINSVCLDLRKQEPEK